MVEEKDKRMRIENESLDNKKFHEAEIQLRLKFESKLNSMHAIHRDLNTKFNQVLDKYRDTLERNEFLETQNKGLDTNIKKLRVTKVELDSKVTFDKEQIDLLTAELNTKTELLDNLTRKLNRIQMEKDNNLHDYNVFISENIAFKNDIATLNERINILKSEKENDQTKLEEQKLQYATLESRYNNLDSKYKEAVSLFQNYEIDLEGFKEIKKSHEERVQELKQEIKRYKKLYDKEVKQHTSTTVELEKTQGMLDSLKEDHQDVIEKFHIANRTRNDIEIQLKDEQQIITELRNDIYEREKLANELRMQIEKHEFTISSLERDLDTKDVKIKTQDKQFASKMDQLNERISQIQSMLSSEKQNKEQWIIKYEREQRQNSENANNLFNINSVIKDKEMEIKDGKIKFDSLKSSYDYLSEINVQTQEKCNTFLTKCENLERVLNTKTLLLDRTENEKQDIIIQNKKKIESIKEEVRKDIDQIGIVLEDYLATGIILHKKVNDRDEIIVLKNNYIKELENKIEILTKELKNQLHLRDKNRQMYEVAKMMHSEEKTMHLYYVHEMNKLNSNYKSLMTTLNLKSKSNETLLIERNQARSDVSKYKTLHKKAEQDMKANKVKISELKDEIITLTEEKKIIIKERDHHYKKYKELHNMYENNDKNTLKVESNSSKNIKRLSKSDSKQRMSHEKISVSKDNSETNYLEIKSEFNNKNMIERTFSGQSIRSEQQAIITQIPIERIDAEVQALTYQEQFEEIKKFIKDEIKVNEVEIQTEEIEKENIEPTEIASIEIQTEIVLTTEVSTETSSELIIPMLESLSISKHIETDHENFLNTQRTDINNNLTITPRTNALDNIKESESKSIKIDASNRSHDENYEDSKYLIDVSEQRNNPNLAINSINEFDYSKNQSTSRSTKKPFAIVKNSDAFKTASVSTRKQKYNISKTSNFEKRSDSHGVNQIKRKLISPIKEELHDLGSPYFTTYFQENQSRENKNYSETKDSRKTDYEMTSSHFQNILTSKYDGAFEQFFDPRSVHFQRFKSKNRKKREQQNHTSPPDRYIGLNDSKGMNGFSLVKNKFSGNVKDVPPIKIPSRSAIKELIKGASSRD